MEQAFEMVTAGTALEGATLELVQVPVTNTCRSCGHVDLDDESLGTCPVCDGTDILHVGGNDLVLESIEYRAPAPSLA